MLIWENCIGFTNWILVLVQEPLSSLPHEFENEIMKDKAKVIWLVSCYISTWFVSSLVCYVFSSIVCDSAEAFG